MDGIGRFLNHAGMDSKLCIYVSKAITAKILYKGTQTNNDYESLLNSTLLTFPVWVGMGLG